MNYLQVTGIVLIFLGALILGFGLAGMFEGSGGRTGFFLRQRKRWRR